MSGYNNFWNPGSLLSISCLGDQLLNVKRENKKS
jgi:hypothetical protein